jgi:Tol biopolymer transport system component
MSRFDRLILAVAITLALAVGVLSVTAAKLGPTVDGFVVAKELGGVSVNSQIGILFTEPMDRRSVQTHFRIRPRLTGDFEWLGNELLLTPRKPLTYGTTYRVDISRGARSRSGTPLLRSFQRTFTTEAQHLLFLGQRGRERGQLVLMSVTGESRIVGSDDGRITDFSIAPSGSLVAYVKQGAARERPDELWLLSATDGSTQRILRQPDWTLSQPHLSADGRLLVFLASNVPVCSQPQVCQRSALPLIYLFNLQTRKLHRFTTADHVPFADLVSFSPSGQLAYDDLAGGSVLSLANTDGSHVLVLPAGGNSVQFGAFDPTGDRVAFVGQTPAAPNVEILLYQRGSYHPVSRVYDAETPAFSQSGTELAYAAYRGERDLEPVYGINRYDLGTHRTRRLTDPVQQSDWDPAWAPDDRYIAFIRSAPQETRFMGRGEIWVMRSDGSQARRLDTAGTAVQWVP